MSLRYIHCLPHVTRIRNREGFLVERCRTKRVLHLGFVDQWLQEEKVASGQWLHAQLAQVASVLSGIDLDGDGVQRAERLGYHGLYVGNVEHLHEIPLNFKDFDVIVAGELIEHVSNVGSFLNSICGVMSDTAELIITTPNGLSLRNAYFPVARREVIHPDHVYLFSPTTLDACLKRAGLKATEFFVYSDPWLSSGRGDSALQKFAKSAMVVFDHIMQASVVRAVPYYANSLVVIAKKSREQDPMLSHLSAPQPAFPS